MDKVSVAVLAALIVLAPLGYGVYHFSQTDDTGDEIIEETDDTVDHSAHAHTAPALEALLMSFGSDQFIAGNVIHDHPMEVRIQWTMESAEGISSGANLATDLDGSWSFDIDVEDRSEDISITFRAHNLPEDTWSDNFTIVIPADVEDNGGDNNTGNNTGNSTDNNTDNNTGNNTGDGNETGVNSPPNCDAGQDLISDVDEIVYLDASNSTDPDGDGLQNPSWQITEWPEDSTASIVNPSNINAEFTPDVIGNFTFEFYVDDGEDFCKDTMQLEAVITVPSISPTTSLQALTNDIAMVDITFTSEGGHVETWEISPSLPPGLNFDIDSGRISGTPSETFEETTFIVYANNSAGSATASITLSAIELGYDVNDLAQFWLDFFFCQTSDDRPTVDDLTTSETEALQCEISITLNETHLLISTNGIPNHDFESTLACSQGGDCTKVQDYTWSIPRNPTNDTTGGHDSANCPEANGEYECAADRGSIAVAMNGVPIFGPEDGPGGDAVAAEHGVYNEDRQPIELGVCHGHAAQGGTYHYHADSNCMHWHPEAGENIKDDYDNSAPELVAPNTYDGNHSKVIGVAFDGYPIYGFWGYDGEMNVVEMKSSYELKSGETGYNGIDDYQYIEGLGHLDVCNGHFGPTPDFYQGIYHYHTTMLNGDGDMGFPYFLICYYGEADMSGDDDDPCAGFGVTWGPGIGPPPPGCEDGGQNDQAEGMVVSAWQLNPFAIIILGLMLLSGWRLWR